MRVWLLILLVGVLGLACSGRSRGGGGSGGSDGSTAGRDAGRPSPLHAATLSGNVWAPGNAPGMVPPGHEIPVFNAVIRLTTTRPPPIPQSVYCERCVEAAGYFATSDHQGAFEIRGVPPGSYWLSVQKGQFRVEREITVTPDEVRYMPLNFTTLPGVHDAARGDWVPRIAVATGSYDDLQDVLGKMDIGEIDASGAYQVGVGSNAIDFYSNGGNTYAPMAGSLDLLVRDLTLMRQYHIIFIPCSSSVNTAALNDQAVLRNIRDYVSEGGKLYVTDWSGEWHDNVFPAEITLEPGEDTPAAAYDRPTDTWNTSLFGGADGSPYDSNNAEAVHDDLRLWLTGQQGPTADNYTTFSTFDPLSMSVVDNWNTIENLTTVDVGVDSEGLPVLDIPDVYVIGGSGTSLPKKPLTVTYEPAGCGRVLYSTYHTTQTAHLGLVPQERILLYLIMEIGVCVERPILI